MADYFLHYHGQASSNWDMGTNTSAYNLTLSLWKRSDGTPSNNNDLVVDRSRKSYMSVNSCNADGDRNVNIKLNGDSGTVGKVLFDDMSTTSKDREGSFIANNGSSILSVGSSGKLCYFYTDGGIFKVRGNREFWIDIAVKSKYEGYSLNWPSGSTISASQDFTYVSVSLSAHATLSPSYSYGTVTYTYRVTKTIDGVTTNLGNMTGLSGSFALNLSASDYGKIVRIRVVRIATTTNASGGTVTLATSAVKEATFTAVKPALEWSSGSKIVATKLSTNKYKITLSGDAVPKGGSGTPTYALKNGTTDVSSQTTKEWASVTIDPYKDTYLYIYASLTSHSVVYSPSGPLSYFIQMLPCFAIFNGTKWVGCDAYRFNSDTGKWEPVTAYVFKNGAWVQGAIEEGL